MLGLASASACGLLFENFSYSLDMHALFIGPLVLAWRLL
ncbi:hypothetical protein DYST_03605 [Dyella terrae]|nr:hypothetical protein DYST_03605 [Dyella terrae]